jgi:hypothetical protein
MATKVLKHTSNSSYTKEVIKVMQKGTAPHIRKNYLFRHAVDANVIHRMKFFQIYFAPYKFDYKLKETRLKIICDFVDTIPTTFCVHEFFKLYKDLLTKINRVDDQFYFCFDDGKPENLFLTKNGLVLIDESKLLYSTDKEYVKLKAIEAGIKYITCLADPSAATDAATADYSIKKIIKAVNEVYG